MRAGKQVGQKLARWWCGILCALCLVLALILAPLVTIASHGPGAYAEALSASADDLAHGHSHDLMDAGPGTHDATDHDHQTMALIPISAPQDRNAAPAAAFMDLYAAAGREREGPQCPPRGRA